MAKHPRFRLSDAAKDALLSDQAALIEAQALRIKELEAKLSAPKKTSKNSHTPPSAGHKTNAGSGKTLKKKPRRSRPGVSRRLAENPDEVIMRRAISCGGCGADTSNQRQHVRHRYDHIDIPPIAPHTTRVELLGGRCACCGARFRACPPEGMTPGTPFGANIHAFLLYLHHSHHVSFERLGRMMGELFGLKISEGAISNAFQRLSIPAQNWSVSRRDIGQFGGALARVLPTKLTRDKAHWPEASSIVVSAPISQMNSLINAMRCKFCYKIQYVEALTERLVWHIRWVNRNGTDFGSISTAA